MKKNDLLFVYGTLRLGESADLGDKRFGSGTFHATFVREDRINADLYDLGWFPGIKLPTEDEIPFEATLPTVAGDVFRLVTDDITRQLDNYEGFPHLYGRRVVQTEGGLSVWVYFYNGEPSKDRLIPHGDWKTHRLDEVQQTRICE